LSGTKHKNATPRWLFVPAIAALTGVGLLAGLQWADQAYPPDLQKLTDVSFVVNDRDGKLLRAFSTKSRRWRLPVAVADVDPRFVKMLLAYEDKRFYRHHGVDVFALMRAGGQIVRHGRIVSGGSTLSMQVARLLEKPERRSLLVKIRQIARAVQIERRLGKQQILRAYLQLAPYGGNIEGIRAASLAYFGKEPKVLNTAEAALLVALPQSPETRRPDRFAKRALVARNRVLKRMALAGVIPAPDGERARHYPLKARRLALPALAAHLSEKAKRLANGKAQWRTTIKRTFQASLETLVRNKVAQMGSRQSIAVIVADHQSGEILAQVSSPDFFNFKRSGEIDMVAARRSPGSALKPFIYGLAFEAGVVHPASLIEDTPQNFAGYRPRNFDLTYQGTVTVSQALQLSLNIPAISLLSAVGPDKLLARFRRANVKVKLPDNEPVGLAIGLGGLGISLRDLVQLYTLLPRGGKAVVLRDGVSEQGEQAPKIQRSLARVSSWYVQDVLAGVSPPKGARDDRNIAYKTGTSYGYRDAWSVGFDGRYVVGVWVGRPDGVPVPGITGKGVAAPILFEAFGRLSARPAKLAPAPEGALQLTTAKLPAILRRFVPDGVFASYGNRGGKAPQIVYPPADVKIDLGLSSEEEKMPLFVKIQGGKPPFRWLANGKPVLSRVLRRRVQWLPDSRGFSTLTVLDAAGRADSVRVFVE
jgi:penicillin-binding protein 1C